MVSRIAETRFVGGDDVDVTPSGWRACRWGFVSNALHIVDRGKRRIGVEHGHAPAVHRMTPTREAPRRPTASRPDDPELDLDRGKVASDSPPARKLAQTSSIVWPLIRSACSTASRTATSVASMSVTKPRLTPRLWRWPVPSTRSRPSSSVVQTSAETFDDPISRAPISGGPSPARISRSPP
jgi:hypothetical protein